MNYLTYPLSKLKIDYLKREYSYTFLNDFNDIYDIYDIEHIYSYLLSIEEYKLKNIWNLFVRKWKHMHLSLQNNSGFKKSKYHKDYVYFNHNNITDDKLDQLVCEFIKKDICRSIFFINSILLSL